MYTTLLNIYAAAIDDTDDILHNGLQVAELLEGGELVGVVRGCIKSVRTPSGSLLKMGYILGLRVSPTFR